MAPGLWIVAGAVAVVILVLVLKALKGSGSDGGSTAPPPATPAAAAPTDAQKSKQGGGGKGRGRGRQGGGGKKKKHKLPTHPLFARQLAGHTEAVTSLVFLPLTDEVTNGEPVYVLCTASTDRTMRFHPVRVAGDEVSVSPSIRVNVDLDHIACLDAVATSERGSMVVGATHNSRRLLVYTADHRRLLGGLMGDQKKKSKHASWALAKEIDTPHTDTIVSVSVATPSEAIGSFPILSCGMDTQMCLHSHKGALISDMDTRQMQNHQAALARNGRFMGAATFTSDVKIWEMCGAGGEFTEAAHVMDLGAHHRSLQWVEFAPDASSVVTASQDGDWIHWNLDVRYAVNEDPRIITHCHTADGDALVIARPSPQMTAVATVAGRCIRVYALDTGELVDTIPEAHDHAITSLAWSHDGALFATASDSGKEMRIWRNPLSPHFSAPPARL